MFQLNHITLNGSTQPRLNGVTLTIPSGRTAIVGYSGAGKTSLLNLLAGFEQADAGTILSAVDDQPSWGSRARLPLYWVPQNGGLWPHLTVEQHLRCVSSAESTDKLLHCLDLEHRRSALPAELSLGERSRLALGRALATHAAVLLLDEPLSHVDPVRKSGYWNVIREWIGNGNHSALAANPLIRPGGHLLPLEGGEGTSMKAAEIIPQHFSRNNPPELSGTSIVFTSHEPETVLRHAENVICLQEGRAVFQGTTASLYDSPPSRDVGMFLGPLNWFDAEDADLFVRDREPATHAVAIRPERMVLAVDDGSSIEYISLTFSGGHAESVVRHVASGKTRTVLHQVPVDVPSTGRRVRLSAGGQL